MKQVFLMVTLAICGSFFACQKEQTDQERRAEIEREVQQRLAAEHQQAQTQQLDQREAELNAREQSLQQDREKALAARGREGSPSDQRVARETTVTSPRDSEPTGSYSMFYTKLEPYGDWVETRDYGYVYRPREAASAHWRPYTNGRWVYTDSGWTWISDEPFGWATYHYGRWTRIHGVGWVWVPGDEWAPAWVSWRKGGEYVGWAPLPPEARFDHRRGIHNWSDSYYDVGPGQYVFVPAQQFGEERIERAILPEQQNVTILNQTTNVTKITYDNRRVLTEGPSYDELKAQSRTPIQRLRLERQGNVQVNDSRPVVRGEVVEFPAPVIAPAQSAERPRTVKQTIAQTGVDLGWGAINNARQAEQTRAKIQAEATPPADAPPKKFVRATDTSLLTTPTSGAATPMATSATSAAPDSAEKVETTSRPTFTPRANARSTAAPIPSAAGSISTATPRSSATVFTATPEPTMPASEQPTPSAAATPNGSTSAAETASGSEPSPPPAGAPSSAPSGATDGQRKRLKSVARQFEKRSIVPMPSASISPGTSPSTGGESSPTDRRKDREYGSPAPATPAASPSATNDLSPGESGTRRDGKRRSQTGAAAPSQSPSPSAAPQQ